MISKDFINNNKLATLDEMEFLLLELLENNKTLALNEVSRQCKERSLNFAFAFENTLSYLQHIGLLKLNEGTQLISRGGNADINYESLPGLLLQRTLYYLGKRKIIKKIFNLDTLIPDTAANSCTLHLKEIPPEYSSFIKVFFLNCGIAELINNKPDMLMIKPEYKHTFISQAPDGHTVIEPGKKPTFFISYAHEDEKYKEELKSHLSGLVNKGIIESWDGRAILPGQDWDNEVKEKLEQAQVVLFLVSSDFMNSSYINSVEIKNTMERHNKGEVKIIPILLRPCDYPNSPIGRYQVLPTGAKAISEWDNKDQAYLNIVNEIKRTLEKQNRS